MRKSARSWLRRGAAFAVACWLVPAAGVADPASGDKIYHASAQHRFGSCAPLPPNSPAGQGVQRLEAGRVYRASALHPFAVGHYGSGHTPPQALALARAYTYMRLPGDPARGVLVELPVESRGCPR